MIYGGQTDLHFDGGFLVYTAACGCVTRMDAVSGSLSTSYCGFPHPPPPGGDAA